MTEENQDEGLQMSFLEHLDELRRRLIHSFLAIGIAFIGCYFFSDYMYRFLETPVKREIRKARLAETNVPGTSEISQLISQLKENDQVLYTFARETSVGGVLVPLGTTVRARAARAPDGKMTLVTAEPWVVGDRTVIGAGRSLQEFLGQEVFGEEDKLVITTVGGAFSLYIKVALYAAVAFAIPFLIYQIWAFVSPGLYKHEKKYILPLLLMSTFFFVLGATFAYRIAFPAACTYLLDLQKDFRSLINAEDYFDLIIIIMLGLGIVFQIPTIAFLLGRLGLVTPGMMWKAWRFAIIIIMIIAAILTPTADAFNMLLFAGPMLGLYFLSIGIVWLFGKPRRSDAEVALAHGE
jgi:sec-independent protein translocase protein TatC